MCSSRFFQSQKGGYLGNIDKGRHRGLNDGGSCTVGTVGILEEIICSSSSSGMLEQGKLERPRLLCFGASLNSKKARQGKGKERQQSQ